LTKALEIQIKWNEKKRRKATKEKYALPMIIEYLKVLKFDICCLLLLNIHALLTQQRIKITS